MAWASRAALAVVALVVAQEDLQDIPRCAEIGVGYDDATVTSVNGGILPTAGDCQKSCKASDSCTFFTYYPDSQACWLQGKTSVARTIHNAISGPKECTSSRLDEGLLEAAEVAAAAAKASGDDLAEQVTAGIAATKTGIADHDLSPEQAAEVATQAASDIAAKSSAVNNSAQGESDAVVIASEAAEKAAKEVGLSKQQQEKQATDAASATAEEAAKAFGMNSQEAALRGSAAAYAVEVGLGPTPSSRYTGLNLGGGLNSISQAAQYSGMLAATAAAKDGKGMQAQATAAATAARKVAASAGLTEKQQTEEAAAAAAAAAASSAALAGRTVGQQATLAAAAALNVSAAAKLSVESQVDLAVRAIAGAAAEALPGDSETEAARIAAEVAKEVAEKAGLSAKQISVTELKAAAFAVAASVRNAGGSTEQQAVAAATVGKQYGTDELNESERNEMAISAAGVAAAEASQWKGDTVQDQALEAEKLTQEAAQDIDMSYSQAFSRGSAAASAVKEGVVEQGNAFNNAFNLDFEAERKEAAEPWAWWKWAILAGIVVVICLTCSFVFFCCRSRSSGSSKKKQSRSFNFCLGDEAETVSLVIHPEMPKRLKLTEWQQEEQQYEVEHLRQQLQKSLQAQAVAPQQPQNSLQDQAVLLQQLQNLQAPSVREAFVLPASRPIEISYQQWAMQWQPGVVEEVLYDIPAGAYAGATIMVDVEGGMVVPTTVPHGALPGMSMALRRGPRSGQVLNGFI